MSKVLGVLVLCVAITAFVGCGEESKNASPSGNTQTATQADEPASADVQGMIQTYNELVGSGTEQLATAVQNEDEAEAQEALKSIFEADTAQVLVGSSGSIECADEGRIGVVVMDSWDLDGDVLLGFVENETFVGYQEIAGEDQGYLTGACEKGIIGELKPVSEQEVEPSDESGLADKHAAANARTNAQSVMQTIEVCAVSTTRGTLIEGSTNCASAAAIREAEPSLAKLLAEDSCGKQPCVVISDATATSYLITSYTDGDSDNVYRISRTDSEIAKTCEGPECPSGRW